MPYKNPEDRRRYDTSPARRAKAAERSRQRYHSDPRYRQATNRRATQQHRLIIERINRIKTQRGCVDCGYAEHPAALDFDHVNGPKLEDVSRLARRSAPWSTILAEIDKCEVRCANCHRIRTMERAKDAFKPAADSEAPEQLSWWSD